MDEVFDISALQAAKAEIDAKLEQARLANRAGAVATVKALLSDYGISGLELGFAVQAKEPRKPRPPRGSGAPKYRDIATGNTWVGRGKRPQWLTAALAQGRTLQSFEIVAGQ